MVIYFSEGGYNVLQIFSQVYQDAPLSLNSPRCTAGTCITAGIIHTLFPDVAIKPNS